MGAKVLPLLQRSARQSRARPDFDVMRQQALEAEQAALVREREAFRQEREEHDAAVREVLYLRGEVARLKRQVDSRKRGAEIKRALKAAGITQTQVAAEARVTKSTVCHVLAGRAKGRHVLEAIERLLGRPTGIPSSI